MKKVECFSCAGIGYFRTGPSFLTRLEKCKDCKGKGYIIKGYTKREMNKMGYKLQVNKREREVHNHESV